MIMYLNDQESELKHRGYTPADHYMHDLLRRYRPGWALSAPLPGMARHNNREFATRFVAFSCVALLCDPGAVATSARGTARGLSLGR